MARGRQADEAGAKPKGAATKESKPAKGGPVETTRVVDLVYEALETELGGVEVYRTALECVRNEDLREEWTKYLEETEGHVRVMTQVCLELGLDPDRDTPGRQV